MSSERKAAATGLIAMSAVWGLFTVWIAARLISGMSGEEFGWMVVFGLIGLIGVALLLGSIFAFLGISLFVKALPAKALLVGLAIVAQITTASFLPDGEQCYGCAPPINIPYWLGSGCLWVIAIITQIQIADIGREHDHSGE